MLTCAIGFIFGAIGCVPEAAGLRHIGNPDALFAAGGSEMNIHQEAANKATTDDVKEFSERRLWSAVLLQALEDWGSMNCRHREEAEQFFFKNPEDFARVCRGAGLAPSGVLARLEQMKAAAPKRRPLEYMFHRTPQAA
jgi:hypothetical protein